MAFPNHRYFAQSACRSVTDADGARRDSRQPELRMLSGPGTRLARLPAELFGHLRESIGRPAVYRHTQLPTMVGTSRMIATADWLPLSNRHNTPRQRQSR
jgi:hypothetical protein